MRKLILSSLLSAGLVMSATGCGSSGDGGIDGGGLTISKFGAYELDSEGEDEGSGVVTPFDCGGTFAEDVFQNAVRVRIPNANGEVSSPFGNVTRLYAVPVVFSNLERVTVRLQGYRVNYTANGFAPSERFEPSSGLLQSSNPGEGTGSNVGGEDDIPGTLNDCLPVLEAQDLKDIRANLASYSGNPSIVATVVAEGLTSGGDQVVSNPLDFVIDFRP